MENQRRSGNLEPFIPAFNWLHFNGGFKRRSIWLYQNGPSWQPHWALLKHRSKSGSKTAAPSSKSCGKVEKSPQSNMLLPVNLPPARLRQLLPGTFHRLKESTVSTPVYLRAAALPTRLRLHRFWQTTPGTQLRTLRRICSLLWSSTTTTPP